MNLVAIIPARGGSRGLPGKNVKLLDGKPLIAYTIEEALRTPSLSRTIVSTDDSKIAEVAKRYGAEVPFLRPPQFAQDNTPMIEVLLHCLNVLEEENCVVDALVLLQPTSPLRKAKHITDCTNLFLNNKPDSVVSVMEVPHHYSAGTTAKLTEGKLLPLEFKNFEPQIGRQYKEVLFARNGPAIAILKPNVLRCGSFYGSNICGYKMDRWSSIDIDDADDFRLAQLVMKGFIVGGD